MKTGYIYIIRNEEHKENRYKIGFTSRAVGERIMELNNETSNIGIFKEIASFPVSDVEKAEALCHKALKKYHKQKEFFDGPISEILKIVEEKAEQFIPQKNISKDLKDISSMNQEIKKFEELIELDYLIEIDTWPAYKKALIHKKDIFEEYFRNNYKRIFMSYDHGYKDNNNGEGCDWFSSEAWFGSKKILSNYSRYQFHSLYHRIFLPYIFRWKRGDYDEVITQNNVEFSNECYKLFLTERHLSSITNRHYLKSEKLIENAERLIEFYALRIKNCFNTRLKFYMSTELKFLYFCYQIYTFENNSIVESSDPSLHGHRPGRVIREKYGSVEKVVEEFVKKFKPLSYIFSHFNKTDDFFSDIQKYTKENNIKFMFPRRMNDMQYFLEGNLEGFKDCFSSFLPGGRYVIDDAVLAYDVDLLDDYLFKPDRLDDYKKDHEENPFGSGVDSVVEEIINNQKISDVPIRSGKHSKDRNLRDSASLLYFPFSIFRLDMLNNNPCDIENSWPNGSFFSNYIIDNYQNWNISSSQKEEIKIFFKEFVETKKQMDECNDYVKNKIFEYCLLHNIEEIEKNFTEIYGEEFSKLEST